MPWLDVIRNAWLVLLGGIFIKAILPAHLAYAVRPLLLSAPLLVLIAKDLSHLPDALARTRDALHGRAWRRLPAAWLPPELVGLIRLDRDLRRACLQWLLRRPPPQAPAGRAFSYLEQGSYRTVVAIVLFSTCVELPIHAAVLPFFVHDAGTLHLFHLAMLAAVLSTLAWLFGLPLAAGRRPSRADRTRPAAADRRPHPRPGPARFDSALCTHRPTDRARGRAATASNPAARCARPHSISRMSS